MPALHATPPLRSFAAHGHPAAPTNHDDALGLGVLYKSLQAIHKVGAWGVDRTGGGWVGWERVLLLARPPTHPRARPPAHPPTVEGVAADAHHCALPQALIGCLKHSLVGEGACVDGCVSERW